uniref:Serpin domain-containing protein n=1 Tax=Anser cygnoides TaxID=8845 RepID=A0A8B9IL51_ANSCY
VSMLSAANAKFCLDFFKDLIKVKRNENIFSPLNISAALSIVQLGAGGNTAKEMEKVGSLRPLVPGRFDFTKAAEHFLQ